jgi:hypothetical protein
MAFLDAYINCRRNLNGPKLQRLTGSVLPTRYKAATRSRAVRSGCLSQLPPPQNLTLYSIRPADNNSSIESKAHCDIRGYLVNHGNTSEILGYLTPWGPQM